MELQLKEQALPQAASKKQRANLQKAQQNNKAQQVGVDREWHLWDLQLLVVSENNGCIDDEQVTDMTWNYLCSWLVTGKLWIKLKGINEQTERKRERKQEMKRGRRKLYVFAEKRQDRPKGKICTGRQEREGWRSQKQLEE